MVKQVTLHDDWPLHDPWGLESDEYGDRINDGNTHVATSFFSAALQVWCVMREGEAVTVGSAALAFNVTPDVILEAVNNHPFMFATGDFLGPLNKLHIEHDGE